MYMSSTSETNESHDTKGNNESVKIPLSECKHFTAFSSVRVFKVEKHIVERNGDKVWISSELKEDWQKDEAVPTAFNLYMQSTGAFGATCKITEEMLEGMLAYVKAEKQKVYSMKGC